MMKSMINGIAERKNADIDALTNQVTLAQFRVNELTTVVTSLTAKQTSFAARLSDADTKKDAALTNLNLAKTLVANVNALQRYSVLVGKQTDKSLLSVKETATHMSQLIEELVFSADIVEKLTGFVNRQKAANNAIPGELVSVLNQATLDANSAVALTLTALQSSYATAASTDQVSSVSTLQIAQANQWLALLTGTDAGAQESKMNRRAAAIIKNVEKALKTLGKTQRESQSLLTVQHKKALEYEEQLWKINLSIEPTAALNLTVVSDDEKGDNVTKEAGDEAQPEKKSAQLASLSVTQQQDAIQSHQSLESARQDYQNSTVTLANVTQQAEFYIAQLNQVIRNQQDNALSTLIQKAYQRAVENYQLALAASNMTNTQLESAKADLARATALLNSLTAGLGAAKAAAYAA